MAKQENNRRRASVPVSGLDTSTPDLTVTDGKCEELHNLRWETGGWHNIDPLKIIHSLRATDGNRERFSKLSIIYHHPATGDDTYIASVPNADGTIDLLLATVADGTLSIDTDNICPIYIDNRMTGGVETMSQAVFLVSLKAVASDVSVEVNYSSTIIGREPGTATLAIPKGALQSENYINNAISENNDNAYPVPSRDGTYRYMVFASEEAARNYNGAFATGLPADIRITHFGNVLIVTDPANRRVIYYYLNKGSYEEFQIPRPPVVRQSAVLGLNGYYYRKENPFDPDESGIHTLCTGIMKYEPDNIKNGVPFYNISTGTFYIPQVSAEYFWGEVCFFAAFRMSDGSVVAPSALVIAASEPFAAGTEYRKYWSAYSEKTMQPGVLYTKKAGDDKLVYIKTVHTSGDCTPFTFWIRPYITLTIPRNLNTRLVESVVIYSTRINPTWDSEKLNDLRVFDSGIESRVPELRVPDFWADNRLPEQPFYFVKSIPIGDFTDSEYSMYLGGDLLEDIEHNSAYEPIDAHSLYFGIAKEYNSRIHVGGELATKLFDGYGSDFFPATTTSPEYSLLTDVRIDDTDYSVETSSTGFLQDETQLVLNKILSYPDSRATLIYSPGNDAGDGYAPASIKLQPATANNFAWAVYEREYETYQLYDYYYVKYSAAFYKAMQEDEYRDGTGPGLPTNPPVYVPQSNKLRVSAPNNPFSFPLANSYAIGTESNRILAVNSAAIEMSDAKFGEFPLYVFTEEGVFTLQSGNGEVLYSATIPLNYDRIVNPATLAVNHNILYITARGIMAMFSNESRLISEPLNDLHNMPPLDYLLTAKMCYQPSHNEVIVWNPERTIGRAASGTRAYVYSLDGSYWSTRDLDGVKLNTNELFFRRASDHILLLDLNEEEARPDQPVRVRMVTRPLKFGSTEYKRLESLLLRLHTPEAQPMRLLVEGSADLKTWFTLRDTHSLDADRDILLRRFPCSMCYLRVTFEATVGAPLEFTQFDMEYYLRFLHRLR
jgi:hypothetical protein